MSNQGLQERGHLADILAPIVTAVVVVCLGVAILLSVNAIKAGNRAIGCVLGIDPAVRTDQVVASCFTEQGLDPP